MLEIISFTSLVKYSHILNRLWHQYRHLYCELQAPKSLFFRNIQRVGENICSNLFIPRFINVEHKTVIYRNDCHNGSAITCFVWYDRVCAFILLLDNIVHYHSSIEADICPIIPRTDICLILSHVHVFQTILFVYLQINRLHMLLSLNINH